MSSPLDSVADRKRGALLALAAAYVDTCGFIGLFGLFTAHVTGNFVLIGAELVNRHADILTKLLALPVFLISVLVTAQTEVLLNRRGKPAAAQLLAAEAILIIAATVAPWFLLSPTRPDDMPSVVVGFLLIAAMGIQNALMRTSLAGSVQTTVMTGNITQLAIDLLAVATDRADGAVKTRVQKSWPAVIAFAVGSALGAAGYAWLGFQCLWFAVALVFTGAKLVHVKGAAL